MKTSQLRRLAYYELFRLPWAEEEAILLRVKSVSPFVADMGGAACVAFHIVDKKSGKIAGEIALRIGEDKSLFYLGHIGYHIDPPYRGRHLAQRACQLCRLFLAQLGMRTVVITTDEDNLPSIRTCENLGCHLESIVEVPQWCIEEFQISSRKRRYVFFTA